MAGQVAQQTETWEDVPAAAPPPDAAPTQDQPAPAAGEQGRQVTIHARAPPKPPLAPIAPHPSVPVTVEPNVVTPAAQGQKPPPASKETWEDVPAQWPGYATDVGKSALSGLTAGAAGLAGAPRDVPNLVDYGLDWAGAHVNQALGGENAQEAIQRTHGSLLRQAIGDNAYNALSSFNPWPSGASLQGKAQQAFPPLGYQPQSAIGRYTHELAAFAPGALIPFGEAGVLSRLGSTIAPAIGSETLGHATEGTQFEPWARLFGAGLGSLGQTAARGYTAPMTAAGQKDVAAGLAQKAADDPAAALQKIRAAQAQRQPDMATGEDIPGSRPTPSQITGDPGQIVAERAYQTEFPNIHSARMQAQSEAQTQALKGVQPTGGPENVAQMITKRLQDIDAQHETDVAEGRQMAEGVHAATQQRLGTQAQTAEEAARTEAGKVARKGEPEALGERARGALAESMARAKEKEKRLWEAIDAHKIGVWTNQVGARARDVARRMGLQKPMGGEEKAIFDAAGNLPRWTRLSDLTDLTSRLKAEMRNERFTNGNTPALKRMTQLLKTSENVIKNAATRQSAKEAQAEMEGLRRMTLEDRAQITAARAATRARGEIERGPAGPIIRQGATSGAYRTLASQVPGKVFAKGATGYQKAKAYAEATGKPWLDPFKDIVSDSLAREATTDGMIDPTKLTRWQGNHRDALRALPDDVHQDFIKGPAEAAGALTEQAAQRRTALISHSKLDVGKEFDKRLAAGSPTANAMRADPAFKNLEGQTNPRDAQKIISGIMGRQTAVGDLQRLAREISGNPNAVEGLKHAAVDHIIEKTLSTTPVGQAGEYALKPGEYQKVIANNRALLGAAGLDAQQIDTLERIAADIKRQQSFYSTTVKGSPTAQNLLKPLKQMAAHAHNNAGWIGTMIGFGEGARGIHEYLPHMLQGPATLGLAGASYAAHKVLSGARNRGLSKAMDLYHEAVMNPDAMADLLSRPSPGSHARLSRTFARHAMYAGFAGERATALHH